MKKINIITIIITAMLCLLISTGKAQNLVPNPSFEDTVHCPTTLDQINYSTGWSTYCVTPDYYNACNGNVLGVPSNGIGYQAAASGNGYAGFTAYNVGGFAREIIGRQLSQTLLIGQTYYVSIKVSLAEFEGPPPQFVPCNKVGAKFSTIPYSASNPAPVNNFAHVYTNTIIGDTTNWTTIKGFFMADSSYQFIMIGNFFDDAHTDTINRPNGVRSYFFLDDICVSTDSSLCYHPVDVPELQKNEAVIILPNPANDFIFIDVESSTKLDLSIYNMIGERVLKKEINNNSSINVSDLLNGIYIVRINFNNKITNNKLIINHN